MSASTQPNANVNNISPERKEHIERIVNLYLTDILSKDDGGK